MPVSFEKIIRQYFTEAVWKVNTGSSGMNNTTKFVTIQDEKLENSQYVLRIYESHQDKEKILFEHEVLGALGKKSLPFSVPRIKATLKGQTIAKTEDGKLVSLAVQITGENPKLDTPKQCYSLGTVLFVRY